MAFVAASIFTVAQTLATEKFVKLLSRWSGVQFTENSYIRTVPKLILDSRIEDFIICSISCATGLLVLALGLTKQCPVCGDGDIFVSEDCEDSNQDRDDPPHSVIFFGCVWINFPTIVNYI